MNLSFSFIRGKGDIVGTIRLDSRLSLVVVERDYDSIRPGSMILSLYPPYDNLDLDTILLKLWIDYARAYVLIDHLTH